ncbi:hypothetical protein B0I37DRAFT_167305 [Chaetomium sp. MPI-CAGE-AT-0009]|nr:hypothetical protein B0I37DRAFT_167305 [Chaetomium sp. MPI-CAGE-AT-0009]
MSLRGKFFSHSPDIPGGPCQAFCCKRGAAWAEYHWVLDVYHDGPSSHLEELDTLGCWKQLITRVRVLAESMQRWGLVQWQELSPDTRGRLESWSSVAQELWESDFVAHREGIVQACIWHYLDDNLFSFAPDLEESVLVKASSPVWEHVRGLRRHLNALSTREGNHGDITYPVQFSAWNRLTEHLVRRGLGLQQPVAPADLVAHFKSFHRQFVVNGEDQFPAEDPHARDLDYIGVNGKPSDGRNEAIRRLLRSALRAQVFLHGVRGGYALRFSPIGSYETFEFPFDENWMQPANAAEVPPTRNNQPREPLPPVQLVTQPMLVASGLDSLDFGRKPTLVTHMQVITPWTFGGPEAKEFIRPGFEKGWELLPAEVFNERAARGSRERVEQFLKELKERRNTPEGPVTDGQTAESLAPVNVGESTNQETD